MQHKIKMLLLSLCISHSVWGDLTVIADFGGESAVRFYEALQPEHDENAPNYPNSIPASVSEADILPVVSHKLSPGIIETKQFDLTGIQAIFLIGADNTSAQWLQQNREKLITLNATGLVVNVRTLAELNQLREIVPEIIMLPIPGDDLAERIGIAHYPALITETGVSQ
ncbi:TPA: integrating conjugative element protein [Mannheimia haemolytica]|uniref:integrating conjugative element protein n=1 Tax=Mannheimia haemolytica TaxID=75985 RepID=UPI0001594CB2|nr:integrating conjugative element protein [Mannheimia haemolytica]AGI32926.2 integrating conjugative element protein [Mannheimia haemolytica USDA-ARS-USMARC-183]AGQ26919.1 hypothetical protein F382_13530 [Mannheimia haemolytica D153]AGQ42487.1 hypothetical protein J451_13775 [Mannheimia haemolytica D174]AGR75312.1 hypothetical protein N220_08345 [Mannheimia haemolytica USMARC_2286]AKA11639.1 hypothetical protein WC39_08125 [Mannheimia haemolytica]